FYYTPQKPGHNSYSIAFPWNTQGTGAAPYWKSTSNASVPLISDMALRQAPSDGIADAVWPFKKINSPNHEGDGQNIGYADAHVEWNRNPTEARSYDGVEAPTDGGSTKNDSIFHWGGYDPATKQFGPLQKQSSAGITFSEPPTGFDIYMVPQRDANGKTW
ncbi:MAG: hypothetical protein WCI73_10025, partial [Phycisphaerae bacterium]